MCNNMISWFLACLMFIGELTVPMQAVAQESTTSFTVAVLDLDPIGVSPTEAQGLSDKLRSHITGLKQEGKRLKFDYEIIERTQIDKIFDQFEVQNTGCVSDSCAVKFGKMLQADRIVIGSVSRIGQTYSVIIRIVDVETGKTIGSTDKSSRGSIDSVISKVIPAAGDALFLVPVKKSRKKMYILAGTATVAAAYLFLRDDSTTTPPVVMPDPPSRP